MIIRHKALLATTALATVLSSVALAEGPGGEIIAAGEASVSRPDDHSTVVNQRSAKAIIDWRDFSISADHNVEFVQPDMESVILNRVYGGEPSKIYGGMSANGTVMLVNPDGILFGAGSTIDVGGLVATTSDIANAEFMSGNYEFSKPGNPSASVINEGLITAREGGITALVAPGVRNSGIVSARLGTVAAASANEFTLDLYGDSLVKLKIDDEIADEVIDLATGQTMSALVDNQGTLSANGGTVALTATSARRIVDHVINNDGVIEANSVGVKAGKIVLGTQTASSKAVDAPDQRARVSGTLSAQGRDTGEVGGDIAIVGEIIGLTGADMNANGSAGGGTVLVGGDVQGGNADPEMLARYGLSLEEQGLETATAVTVDENSTINASATRAGDGGKVVVWADNTTRFAGEIQAQGGSETGDGGFVEVSGRNRIDIASVQISAAAPHGSGGTVLFDPDYLIIYHYDEILEPLSFPNNVARPHLYSFISDADVSAILSGGSNVILDGIAGIEQYSRIVNTFNSLEAGILHLTGSEFTTTDLIDRQLSPYFLSVQSLGQPLDVQVDIPAVQTVMDLTQSGVEEIVSHTVSSRLVINEMNVTGGSLAFTAPNIAIVPQNGATSAVYEFGSADLIFTLNKGDATPDEDQTAPGRDFAISQNALLSGTGELSIRGGGQSVAVEYNGSFADFDRVNILGGSVTYGNDRSTANEIFIQSDVFEFVNGGPLYGTLNPDPVPNPSGCPTCSMVVNGTVIYGEVVEPPTEPEPPLPDPPLPDTPTGGDGPIEEDIITISMELRPYQFQVLNFGERSDRSLDGDWYDKIESSSHGRTDRATQVSQNMVSLTGIEGLPKIFQWVKLGKYKELIAYKFFAELDLAGALLNHTGEFVKESGNNTQNPLMSVSIAADIKQRSEGSYAYERAVGRFYRWETLE